MRSMTEETTFLDTSVFLCFFIEGKSVLETLPENLITSTNVIEELTYILIKHKAEETRDEKHYETLSFLRGNPSYIIEIFEEIKRDIETVLTTLSIKVVEPADFQRMWNIIEKYGLLPNDALISATCRLYGIGRIATFDEDFKKVDLLEVLKPQEAVETSHEKICGDTDE